MYPGISLTDGGVLLIYNTVFQRNRRITIANFGRGKSKGRVGEVYSKPRTFSLEWSRSGEISVRAEGIVYRGGLAKAMNRLLFTKSSEDTATLAESRTRQFQFSLGLLPARPVGPSAGGRGRHREKETWLIFEISFWPRSNDHVHFGNAFRRCNQGAVDDKSGRIRVIGPAELDGGSRACGTELRDMVLCSTLSRCFTVEPVS